MQNGKLKIVGIGGSMSPTSTSLTALRVALEGAEESGAETEMFDIRTMNLPMYMPGIDIVPASAQQFADSAWQADGMIWSSPMYHGSVSGAFKNALDWLQLLSDRKPPFLTDKIVGLISTAGGTQGLQAVNTMEFIVRALRGWAVPLVIPVPQSWKAFDESGAIKSESVEKQLYQLGSEVVRAARQFSTEGRCDYSHPIAEHS